MFFLNILVKSVNVKFKRCNLKCIFDSCNRRWVVSKLVWIFEIINITKKKRNIRTSFVRPFISLFSSSCILEIFNIFVVVSEIIYKIFFVISKNLLMATGQFAFRLSYLDIFASWEFNLSWIFNSLYHFSVFIGHTLSGIWVFSVFIGHTLSGIWVFSAQLHNT